MFELTPLEDKNLKLIFDWRNSIQIREKMLCDQLITWEEHCAWYERLKERTDQDFLVFNVENKPLGIVFFKDICLEKRSCSWGFYIGSASAPKGTGTLMAYHAIEYMILRYDLAVIHSQVIACNAASLAYHRKLQFKQIGMTKELLYRNDSFYPLILFSLFIPVWNSRKEKIYQAALEKFKR